MANVLILYSTVDGQTLKICERIRDGLMDESHAVSLESVDNSLGIALDSFDLILIGASIRYGKHRPSVREFVDKHKTLLDSKANAFFSVNVVARKPEKNRPETNPYMTTFLKGIRWRPKRLAVFAGKIDYPKYSFWDRNIIRLIMWMTKGPTEPDAVVEFTDWNKVDAFALQLCEDIQTEKAAKA